MSLRAEIRTVRGEGDKLKVRVNVFHHGKRLVHVATTTTHSQLVARDLAEEYEGHLRALGIEVEVIG